MVLASGTSFTQSYRPGAHFTLFNCLPGRRNTDAGSAYGIHSALGVFTAGPPDFSGEVDNEDRF
jgi:hypothetical protein